MTTLPEAFARQVSADPDAIAVSDPARRMTYAQLDAESLRIARYLAMREARTRPIGLLLDRSCHLVAGVLGILRAGAAYLPVDLTAPDERVRAILDDAGCTTVVTTSDLADRVAGLGAQPVCADTMEDPPAAAPLPVVAPDDLAYIIYTSGSTGAPKGVMVEHRQVIRLLAATDRLFELRSDDVWALFHSSAFDASVWEIWGALSHGAHLTVVPYWTSRSPEAFLGLLEQQRVTVLAQTQSAFQALIRADTARGSRAELALRYVHLGGEKLDFGVLRPWFTARGDATPEIYNMYGPTETTVYATCRRVRKTDVDREASLIGFGLNDLTLRILDAEGRPVADGVPGDLHVGGPGVTRGYLRRPELTARRFPEYDGQRFYRTGDLVRRLPDGELEYLGRLDDQVQVRGFRVELGEVESRLRTHVRVSDCVVAARLDAAGTTTLAAYVITGSGSDGTGDRALAADLRKHLEKLLPDYMLPSSFTVLESFPLNQNGKVDRAALPDPSAARPASQARPGNAIERALCAAWAEGLGVAVVGPEDDVYLMGGHSLIAAQVAMRMREHGYQVPLRVLLNHRSPRAAATRLADA